MEIERHAPAGAFTAEFAKKKKWKVDEGLLAALLHVIPEGESVVDLGAGVGEYVRALTASGRPAYGVDGIPGVEKLSGGDVFEHDLSSPVYRQLAIWDWCVSIEVGEHIPRDKQSNYIDNVVKSASKGIVLSWATPGQRGRAHVNCRMSEWVACVMALHLGFNLPSHWTLNETLTLEARKIAGKGWDRKLLVFTVVE